MRSYQTIRDKLIEAYQKMDWDTVEKIENNELSEYRNQPIPEKVLQRPYQSESVYYDQKGIYSADPELDFFQYQGKDISD